MQKPMRHTHVHTRPEKMKEANLETRTPYSLCSFENIASWQEEPHRGGGSYVQVCAVGAADQTLCAWIVLIQIYHTGVVCRALL